MQLSSHRPAGNGRRWSFKETFGWGLCIGMISYIMFDTEMATQLSRPKVCVTGSFQIYEPLVGSEPVAYGSNQAVWSVSVTYQVTVMNICMCPEPGNVLEFSDTVRLCTPFKIDCGPFLACLLPSRQGMQWGRWDSNLRCGAQGNLWP